MGEKPMNDFRKDSRSNDRAAPAMSIKHFIVGAIFGSAVLFFGFALGQVGILGIGDQGAAVNPPQKMVQSARAPAKNTSRCAQIPVVPWWGDVSHRAVTSYVNKKHGGDWTPYIDKWENQLTKLKGISAKGRGAVISSKDITLEGPRLDDYIAKVGQRLSAIRCLGGSNHATRSTGDGAMNDGKSLADFETAAGPSSRQGKPSSDRLDLGVSSQCINGRATFTVVNNGNRWPGVSNIRIHRLDNGDVLSRQRLVLKRGQKLSFNTRLDNGNGAGIWIDPAWYARDPKFDAVIMCG